jgi:hypothetical protein
VVLNEYYEGKLGPEPETRHIKDTKGK